MGERGTKPIRPPPEEELDGGLGRRSSLLQRALERWRRIEFPVMLGLGLAAVVLGFIGFKEYGESTSDALHRTLQLFAIENIPSGNGAEPDLNPALEVARFLAPFVLGYTAVRAFFALFRAQFGVARLRLTSDHVVICGLGDKGYALAKALDESQIQVAVIERDDSIEAVTGCRDRGIPVVIGDATDSEVLDRARVRRARSLVAVLGDDGFNLDAAFSALEVLGKRKTRLAAFVHLSDLALWRLLTARGIASGHGSRLRLSFFNLGVTAAKLMLEAYPGFMDAEVRDERPRIGVVGNGALAESVILQAARLWRNGRRDIDERLCISLIGADAETEAMRLLDQHPALATICALDPHPLDSFRSSSAEWDEELGDLPALSTVYVCEEDEKAGLAASLAILEAAKPVHVVLAVKNHHVGAAAIIAEGELHELHPFGTHSSTLTEEIFVVGVNETLAEANHAHYLANESARGATTAENPSLVPWDHLDDALKESNRSFADGIGEKLEELNLAIVPSPLADPDRPVLVFTEEEIDQLAPMEHDRWRRDLEAQGWTHGNGAKDPVQLSHPQLVDWEELSREDRDKDRNAVRAIPAILARAGFDIVSVGDAEARHTSAAESRTEEGV